MVQPKFNSTSKTGTPVVSIKWENRGKSLLWKSAYNVIHLVFTTLLISCLIDLLMNGELGPTFVEVSKHFNFNDGFKLESVINCQLWFSVVVLIMEATLHANICFDLIRGICNQMSQQRLPLLDELALGWLQLCLFFVFLDGLVLLRLCEYYISPQVLTLVTAHTCSGFVVLSYIKLIEIARRGHATSGTFDDMPTSVFVISNA